MAKLNTNNLKRLCFYLIFTAFFSTFSFAQNTFNGPSNFWDNVQFGGGLGLNFGNGFFTGAISPNALYRFSPFVATGVGLNFQYSSQRDVFKSTVVGGSVIGLFSPAREIQLSTEFEQLYVNRDFDQQFISNADDSYWYPALFLGVGYTSGRMTFGIRYDVLYDEDKSIQPEAWMPFVRFWF
ncbi:alpha-ketoglutarate decarboxylase [Winogradskyella alexanderae]|uniref:Alpha-ketoglutarate decarboxylase n=1 Tax=Winogradskyella alexanderae TaxID=2877123 RepID=A0ABS7XM16_9FLAO|nr:alpha-ketoglutarate decarboxylase [Winogradskyella alexanderae]MCA0131027.1 alpha-ketoglutarate decarboxylase [Winogradskyella alexanderae]